MIHLQILLPKLATRDQAEFEQLCADFAIAKDGITRYNTDSRVARKKELRAMLKTAPANKLASIGAELSTLDESFTTARRGAKQQLKALGQRFAELFPRLFVRCEEHADKLIETASQAWNEHVEPFGGVAVFGASPVVRSLEAWKQVLSERRRNLAFTVEAGATPPAPRDIIPFPVTATNNPILK